MSDAALNEMEDTSVNRNKRSEVYIQPNGRKLSMHQAPEEYDQRSRKVSTWLPAAKTHCSGVLVGHRSQSLTSQEELLNAKFESRWATLAKACRYVPLQSPCSF